jgi:hypothetical protein
MVIVMVKRAINRWFVSVRPVGMSWNERQTRGFETETEAKQFAKAMLSKGHNVTAGTMNPHQPKRRNITALEVDQWIEEEE